MRKTWIPLALLGVFVVVMFALEINERFIKDDYLEAALIVIDVVALIGFVAWLVREWPGRGGSTRTYRRDVN